MLLVKKYGFIKKCRGSSSALRSLRNFPIHSAPYYILERIDGVPPGSLLSDGFALGKGGGGFTGLVEFEFATSLKH